MKKHIIVLCLILSYNLGIAQNSPPPLTNGELNTFLGSHFLVGNTPCPTFNSNNLLNWFRTHGSPNHDNTTGTVFMFATIFTTGATLGHAGEGIAANYSFKQGLTYYIDIGISHFNKGEDASGAPTGQVEVYAANGLTQGAAIDCGDPIPNIPNKQWIDTYSPSSTSTTNDVFKVSFTANTDFSYFWIYPTCGFCDNSTRTIVSVDYVRVYPCLEGLLINYDDNSSPPNYIKPGYSNAYSIRTASSSNNLTVNDHNTWTWLLGEIVELHPNTEITVNNTEGDPWFLATAAYDCQRPVYHGKSNSSDNDVRRNDIADTLPLSTNLPPTLKYESDSSVIYSTQNLLMHSGDGISLFPNPVSEKLTIVYNNRNSREVFVTINSVNGRNLKKQVFKSDPHTMNTFHMDVSDLPKGVYLIEIKDSDKRVTERITKL